VWSALFCDEAILFNSKPEGIVLLFIIVFLENVAFMQESRDAPQVLIETRLPAR
jgi:hypothetical protein